MKSSSALFFLLLALTACAAAQCPVKTIIIKGHVENPAPNSRVRVQLAYPKNQPGESAETTVEDSSFTLSIEYLTQSSKPLMRNLHAKCGRSPNSVIITLLVGDDQKAQLTLDFPRDFRQADPTAYVPQSEIVLKTAP